MKKLSDTEEGLEWTGWLTDGLLGSGARLLPHTRCRKLYNVQLRARHSLKTPVATVTRLS